MSKPNLKIPQTHHFLIILLHLTIIYTAEVIFNVIYQI
jgi:hypothetical protein